MVEQENIHKLVSLTFDEDPKVRLGAASKLAHIEDPAAIFALMELSYDKDLEVKNFAYNVLDKKKTSEHEVMSFAEIFAVHTEESQDSGESFEQKREKILSPITQLFEKRLGKLKADQVKSKMMPTIEKVYMKSTSKSQNNNENGKQAIQEFLTSYLEAISDIESINSGEVHQTVRESEVHPIMHEAIKDLDVVSKQKDDFTQVTKELNEIELQEKKEHREQETLESLPETVFKRAYETMLASGGDEHLMRKELRRTLRELEHEAKLAYNLAKRRFKETKITQITKIKEGMRNVNTELLTVKNVENSEHKKGKEKKTLTRVLVNDEDGNEGVVYISDNRGLWLKQGMGIKVVRGYVKAFSGETAITITEKGNVYIVL